MLPCKGKRPRTLGEGWKERGTVGYWAEESGGAAPGAGKDGELYPSTVVELGGGGRGRGVLQRHSDA